MLSSASRRTDRAAAATCALLLQLGFIAAFIHGFSAQAPSRQLQKELTFFLPRLSRPEPPPSNPAPRAAAPVLAPPIFVPPPVVAVPLPEAPPAQALQNFGQALQGCAPEDYANLTPYQKARCTRPGDGMAIQQAPNLMGTPSHVKDEAYWEEELAHKKSPTWLPCTETMVVPAVGVIFGVDPKCLVSKIADGTITDPKTWPIYETRQLAPGDFYKIEQAYDAWHKDHLTTPASAEPAGKQPQ